MKVFWDTNLFVYLFEDYGQQTIETRALLDRMHQRGDRLVTSALTLGELLVGPMRASDALADAYEARLRRLAEIIDFDGAVGRIFAKVRVSTDLRPPDAIQLACAAASQSDLFVTNDGRLSRKIVPGVPIMSSLLEVPI